MLVSTSQGGTIASVVGKHSSSRVVDLEMDKTGMGRYSYLLLQKIAGRKILLIPEYFPCKIKIQILSQSTPNNATFFVNRETLTPTQGDNVYRISLQVLKMNMKGHDIIIFMDANEELSQS